MGNVTFSMVEALAALGHEVEVFTPGVYKPEEIRPAEADEAEHEEEFQGTLHKVNKLAPSLSYGNAARLSSLHKELEGFDLIHLHYPFFGTASIVRKFKKRHSDVPLVVTYHMDNRASGLKGLIFSIYGKIYRDRVLNVADALIGSSEDYISNSDVALHASRYGDKWHYLPFGVDTNRFSPGPKDVAFFDQYDLDIEKPTLIFVGGMDSAHYFKGVPILLKALRRFSDVQLLCVGDGNLRPSFESKAAGLAGVRFMGKVSDDELPYVYKQADLCVLPSITVAEAFGMVLLEAMASGLPVLTSDLPGVRSVALRAGETVPAGNVGALASAIQSFFESGKIQGLGAKARSAALTHYSWPVIAQDLEDLYTILVKK